jgi:hypothetical protein
MTRSLIKILAKICYIYAPPYQDVKERDFMSDFSNSEHTIAVLHKRAPEMQQNADKESEKHTKSCEHRM